MGVPGTQAPPGPLRPGRGPAQVRGPGPAAERRPRGRGGGAGGALSAVLKRRRRLPPGRSAPLLREGRRQRPREAPPGRTGLGRSHSGTVPACSRRQRDPPRCGRTRPGLPGPPADEGRSSPRRPVVSQRPPGPSRAVELQPCHQQRQRDPRETRAGEARAELEASRCAGPPSRPGPGRAHQRRAAKGRQGLGGSRRSGPLPRAPRPCGASALPRAGSLAERAPPRSRPIKRPRGRQRLSSQRGAPGPAATPPARQPREGGRRPRHR